MNTKVYMIVRRYQNERPTRVIAKNLTLEAARAWCEDPETSSMTAKSPRGCGTGKWQVRNKTNWHKLNKHWFDGYEEQA
jgi:hypothetical protein